MSAALQPYVKKLDDVLAEKNIMTEYLQIAEDKTGLPKRNIVLGAVALTIVWLAIGIGSSLVCSVICFVYPAYKSFKAVESPDGDDDKQWLTYWIVYSTFNILEYFADLIFFWIPFYDLLKCAFLIWCMWPVKNNGATLVYYHIVRPFLLKNESKIDAKLNNYTDKVNQFADDAAKEASQFSNSATGQLLTASANAAVDQAMASGDDEHDKDE